jgi:hypothetical protein
MRNEVNNTNLMLFKNTEREFLGFKNEAEPDFEYLNRSAKPEVEAIRRTLNGWFDHYPEGEKVDLIARFRSRDNLQHMSAAFELYLHQLFVQLGCKLVQHPDTQSNKETHPDFLVRDPSGVEFYLEAVQRAELSRDEQKAQNQINLLIDRFNRIDSQEFYLELIFLEAQKKSPPLEKLRMCLKQWLYDLDPDEINARVKSGVSAYPSFEFDYDGWVIIFIAEPKSSERRHSQADKTIRSITTERWPGERWKKFRETLLYKCKHYGELELPLIIAVNTSDPLIYPEIMEAALFRQENGFWYSSEFKRYPHLSGILFGYDLKPFTYGVRELTYYMNPLATEKVRGCLSVLPKVFLDDGKVREEDGKHPKEILGLPADYPSSSETIDQK